MPYRAVDPGIHDAVNAAVDVAIASGSLSKSEIVASFAGSGLNQATLFRWIDRRATEVASGVPLTRRKPIAESVREDIDRGSRAMTIIPNGGGVDGGVLIADIIHRNLDVLQRGLAMAMDDDGKLKNTRLMLACVGELGRHITHISRAQVAVALDLSRRNDQFMDDLVDIVMDAIPEKRSEIISAMDALQLRYGRGS